MKLNHRERGIAIAALTEARANWNRLASEERTKGNAEEATRLTNNAVFARDLCTRYEEEQA
jgi:hypothetical protein